MSDTTGAPSAQDKGSEEDKFASVEAFDEALKAARAALDDFAKALGADPRGAFEALERAGRDAGANGLETMSESVRRHPLAWIAGAFGLGLALGLWRKS